MSSSSDDLPDSPLPTPTIPGFVDGSTEAVIHSLHSFSFGGGNAFGQADNLPPVFPPSSFPSYCLPRRGSTSTSYTSGWEISDLEDSNTDGVNPSPVYAPLDENGDPINQCPGTPIAEREKFEYPEFPGVNPYQSVEGLSTLDDATAVPIRPQPTPAPQDRRGSISLPNVVTVSGNLVPHDASPAAGPSTLSSSSSTPLGNPSSPITPLGYLHPASSPFALPAFLEHRRPSLPVLAPPPCFARTSSYTQHQPPLRPMTNSPLSTATPTPGFAGRRGSQSHFHPPLMSQRFHPPSIPTPIPPSLLHHPAFASSSSSPATSISSTASTPHATTFHSSTISLPPRKQPSPTRLAARRGSLPAQPFHLPPSLPNSYARRPPAPTSTSTSASRPIDHRSRSASSSSHLNRVARAEPVEKRRASEQDVGLPMMVEEHGGDRPRLGSIPSFGSAEGEGEEQTVV